MNTDAMPAESSPAMEVPSNPEAYATWRQTGKLPEPKAESAPAKEPTEAAPEGDGKGAPKRESAPESEPEKKQEPKSGAEKRLKEILDDLKRAGLSPAELKTFKREAQQAAKEQPKAAPEKTEKPAGPEAPKRPKVEDFETYEAYEEARDKYYEDLADFKASKKLEEFQQRQAIEASQRELNERLSEASKRYGDNAREVIEQSAAAIFGEKQIPSAVHALINDSPVIVDLMYVLGEKPESLAEFVTLAKTNPAQAVRKVVLMEKLIQDELQGKAKGGDAAPERDASGKFVKQAPEKKVTEAPPPPREVSGKGSLPPDEAESAVQSGDFRTFREAQNRRDIQRMRGNG